MVLASPTSLPLLFPSPPLRLSLCPCYTYLTSVLPSISRSLINLAETIISFLRLLDQATIGFCHLFLTGKDTVNELARRGALLPPHTTSCSLLPIVSTLFFSQTEAVSCTFFHTQVSSVSTKELVLPNHARYVSLLLNSCLSGIETIEIPSCSDSSHLTHLILHCPANDTLRRSLYGDSFSLIDVWSRPWGSSPTLGAPWPHPSEAVR